MYAQATEVITTQGDLRRGDSSGNPTQGDVLYEGASALARLGFGTSGDVLTTKGTGANPVWETPSSAGQLVKVSKTYSDISSLEMAIYTLPADAALTNVYTDITTVFDVSTAVTIGDSGDDNGFQEATDWTSGTGLSSATRGVYVSGFKGMRSTSGTTAISAYNFTPAGGSSLGSSADGVNIGDPTSVASGDTDGVVTPSGLGLKSLYFDGDDGIDIDGAEPFSTTVGTISVWYYNDGTQETKQIMAFGDTDGSSYLSIQTRSVGDDKIICHRQQTDGGKWEIRNSTGEPSASLSIGWHHVCISQNGTAVVCYIDGVELTDWDTETDKSVWMSAELDNGRIACYNFGGNGNVGFITGNIMEIALWNVALTEAEVQDLYDSGDGKLATTYSTGLRVYYSGNNIPATNEAPETSDTQGAVDFYLQIAKE